jgi:hypothetical protein
MPVQVEGLLSILSSEIFGRSISGQRVSGCQVMEGL